MTAHRLADAGGGTASPPAKPKRRSGPPVGRNTEAGRRRHEERVRQAFELRGSGYSYERIAAELNVGIATAHKWCREAMATMPSESAEATRKLALLRCSQLMDSLMTRLRAGDVSLALIDAVLKVQVEFAKLHGIVLDDGGGITINVELPAPRRQAPQAAKVIG
jgi:transposase